MSETTLLGLDAAKRVAAIKAAALVEGGMRVGLGTGSTTAFAIEELGRRIREEGLDIVGTPTSSSASILARRHSVPLRSLDELGGLDIALDGADEVDPRLDLVKGRGAAHTREKVVASEASRFVVLVDESKMVGRLGSRMPVPIEVVPMAAGSVSRRVQALGGLPEIREGIRKDGPVVTDQGFWIIDATFDAIADAAELNRALHSLPGVLEHGLFIGLATDVFVGAADGSVEHLTR
jgi:ribose 5-phosphate isomerase A